MKALKQLESHMATATATLTETIIEGIQDVKGKQITVIDLTQLDDAPADCFIICEGDSTTQVKAIHDRIYRKVKEQLQLSPVHAEGFKAARWICMDYFDVVVQIFQKDIRGYYDLENLWSDGQFSVVEEA